MGNTHSLMKSTLFSVLLLSVSSQSFAACEAEYQDRQHANKLMCKDSCAAVFTKTLEEEFKSIKEKNGAIDGIEKAIVDAESHRANKLYDAQSRAMEKDRFMSSFVIHARATNALNICLLKSWRDTYIADSNSAQKLQKSSQPVLSQSNQPRKIFAIKNPQTLSDGAVSVMLIPTNSTSSKCYDIAYENRGDKNVDVFIKLTLTNNKTGEKGTSVWLGENTQFDGIFGSANTNRLNPKTQMDMSRTGMYNNWLMAKNFIFNNQPSDLYGFNNTVESCDDITAEIPAGGLKWNENAYQRHYDACSSPIKSNRPVGC